MHRRFGSLITLFLAAAALASARQDTTDWPAVAVRLEQAALADDAQGIKDARTACLRLLAAEPSSRRSPVLRYTIAYAGWRLAFSSKISANEQDDFVAEADKQLDLAIGANPKFADAYGLLGAIYGIEIAKNPDLGRTLGPKSGAMVEQAMALEPNNPRLVLLQGETRLNTPAEYGGSAKVAEALFRRALQLFQDEPADKPWPNWGRMDAHAWLGQALAKQGDAAGARAEYEAAMKIAPNSGWIKYVLMSALKK
jgi:tetratricopeptide (TPR) repeat protein